MEKETRFTTTGRIFRAVLALLIAAAVSWYFFEILRGQIPQAQKLGAVDLAVVVVAAIAIGALLNPELLDRLTHLKFGNIEFQLQKLHHAQQDQKNELDDLRFVLTLLLQPSELQHLKDLQNSNAPARTGSHGLRTELRKLRTMGLIRSLKGIQIGSLKDQTKANLKEFVDLTDRGRRYLERLGDEQEGPTN